MGFALDFYQKSKKTICSQPGIMKPNRRASMQTFNRFLSVTIALFVISNVFTFAADVQVIPLPEKIKMGNGKFILKQSTLIQATKECSFQAEYLAKLLAPATGFSLQVEFSKHPKTSQNVIALILDKALSKNSEAYMMKVDEKSVTIKAANVEGIFFGIQTLRQLLPPVIESPVQVKGQAWEIPALVIEDQPRFKWRGMMLDVSRHFFKIDFLKKYIDNLALHKMNIFHLHLTDDQGWRIEIDKYPKLTEIGAWRKKRGDNSPKGYGGYYTKKELKDLVAYAKERNITIIPEFDLPGHNTATLASYPEFGCTGGPYHVSSKWGVHKEVLCAGNEKLYPFLNDILGEIIEIFPSKYIHIGGDECKKNRWKECSKCQAKIKKEGLKNEKELQSYVIHSVEKFLNSKGRQIIGWEEILQGGIAPNAALMAWQGNGKKPSIHAANAGHDVVMSPKTNCYFDYYQVREKELRKKEPRAYRCCVTLENVYQFNPIAKEIKQDKQKHIIGIQGNLWGEMVSTESHAEYMTYPRASAMAEVAWSPEKSRDYESFKSRLSVMLKRLELLKVNYRNPDKNLVSKSKE